jgi:hypothetical protein
MIAANSPDAHRCVVRQAPEPHLELAKQYRALALNAPLLEQRLGDAHEQSASTIAKLGPEPPCKLNRIGRHLATLSAASLAARTASASSSPGVCANLSPRSMAWR